MLTGADCCQVVADQAHHQESGDIQLRTAADGAAQSLLPQQVLAELQQPQEQHVVSHIITHVTPLADKLLSHAQLRTCIGTIGCSDRTAQLVFRRSSTINRFCV